MLGYALAHEALGVEGEAHRAMIREDATELLDELMKERVGSRHHTRRSSSALVTSRRTKQEKAFAEALFFLGESMH